MNRLILIGNGFDLAHGLKTSYKDFITQYLWTSIREFYGNGGYEDSLIKIAYQHRPFKGIKELDYSYEAVIKEIEWINDINNPHDSLFRYKSSFFNSLINKCRAENWVDIESVYFDHLKARAIKPQEIITLNEELLFLKTKLEDYLSKVNLDNSKKIDGFADIFKRPVIGKEIAYTNHVVDHTPIRLHVLNFNYTSTIELYLNELHGYVTTSVNYIHGQLNNVANPIIFGFGDEYDRDYLEFEHHKNNKLFHNIKSFGYFKTRNYHDLVRFLDIDNFQVYIIGHSCGLSDRTMLKYIFEHQKCVSIKIFHHDGIEGFTEKTYEIARHFSNKNDMRLKIAHFDESDNIPQL